MYAFHVDPTESVGSASAFGSRSSSADRLAASPALSNASSAALGSGRVTLAAAEALDFLLDGCLPPSSALQPRLAQSSYAAAQTSSSQDSLGGRSSSTAWPLRLFLSTDGASNVATLSPSAPPVVPFSELARLPELAHFSGYSSVSTSSLVLFRCAIISSAREQEWRLCIPTLGLQQFRAASPLFVDPLGACKQSLRTFQCAFSRTTT